MHNLRGIKKGIEVFVHKPGNSKEEPRHARIIRTYPSPSNWLVVQFDDGNIEQIQDQYVTTMFEKNRKRIF